jgi:flavodoxin
MMKVLVAYYSRTGRTKAASRLVSEITEGDLEEIKEVSDRSGILGYLRSGLDGKTRRYSAIKEPSHDPSRYDLLIVGTPIWAGNISSPMRTYLRRFKDRLPPVALLCTTGGARSEEAEIDLTRIIGRKPLGSLCVKEEETEDKRTSVNLRIFLDSIKVKLEEGEHITSR